MNFLNIFFDKIYVITCFHLKERQMYIIEHFKKQNINFEFYLSTDKKLFTTDIISNSEKSLINSHLNCIKSAKLNNYKNVLICEDDISFIDNLNVDFKSFIDNLPNNWNFLQLGNQYWATHWLRRRLINKNIYQFEWGTGSHCIGINHNVYDLSIRRLENFDLPVDKMYYDLFANNVCYCPEIFIADALSKNNHLNYFNDKFIFESTIEHKK